MKRAHIHREQQQIDWVGFAVRFFFGALAGFLIGGVTLTLWPAIAGALLGGVLAAAFGDGFWEWLGTWLWWW